MIVNIAPFVGDASYLALIVRLFLGFSLLIQRAEQALSVDSVLF